MENALNKQNVMHSSIMKKLKYIDLIWKYIGEAHNHIEDANLRKKYIQLAEVFNNLINFVINKYTHGDITDLISKFTKNISDKKHNSTNIYYKLFNELVKTEQFIIKQLFNEYMRLTRDQAVIVDAFINYDINNKQIREYISPYTLREIISFLPNDDNNDVINNINKLFEAENNIIVNIPGIIDIYIKYGLIIPNKNYDKYITNLLQLIITSISMYNKQYKIYDNNKLNILNCYNELVEIEDEVYMNDILFELQNIYENVSEQIIMIKSDYRPVMQKYKLEMNKIYDQYGGASKTRKHKTNIY